MKANLRMRAIGLASASALALAGLVAVGGPATAADVDCGDTVTANLTLTHDIGPCTGNGLVVGAENITINLGGYSVIGSNTTNMTATEQVGILVKGVRNVTVRNGTVRNFDSGVAIVKGAKNTLRQLIVQDNANHSTLTGALNRCEFGDGITVTNSDNNVIDSNRALRNGPFSGIALVANSNGNVVSGNRVQDQTVDNVHPAFISADNPGGLGPCGPFSATPTGLGRPDQDIGIRIEGPGADNNQVLSNQVSDNMLDGITIHGYVCATFPGGPELQVQNTGNLIQGNNVRRNGFVGRSIPGSTVIQDGIAVLQQGPLGTITCSSSGNSILGNQSVGNARHGVLVAAMSMDNTINQNTVNGNGVDGIRLNGPFTVCPLGQARPGGVCLVPREPRPGAENNTLISNKGRGNGEHDGDDRNPECDNNFWKQNIFNTVNQACVAGNGGTGTVTPTP